MPWMNFDLQDGKPPVGFDLKADDCDRFAQFMAECDALRAEVERLKTTPADKREDLRCVISDLTDQCRAARAEVERLRAEAESLRDPVARPLAEWHEDMGPVLWWCMPVEEGPWVGQPTDSDWPGYHTHWTKCVGPSRAAQGDKAKPKEGETT